MSFEFYLIVIFVIALQLLFFYFVYHNITDNINDIAELKEQFTKLSTDNKNFNTNIESKIKEIKTLSILASNNITDTKKAITQRTDNISTLETELTELHQFIKNNFDELWEQNRELSAIINRKNRQIQKLKKD